MAARLGASVPAATHAMESVANHGRGGVTATIVGGEDGARVPTVEGHGGCTANRLRAMALALGRGRRDSSFKTLRGRSAKHWEFKH